jgi:SAM pointed domain-containing ETS transcription factor
MKQEKVQCDHEQSVLLEQLQSGPQYQFYTAPILSPPQEQYIVYPPSPCPSQGEYQSPQSNQTSLPISIKQEYCFLPPSPPESNGSPSPIHCADIKTEYESISSPESSIDIENLLIKQELARNERASQDYQLLREYLQDTTFQRKHNLKPLALESLLGGWTARGDIEPVISLALEQARKDVEDTCAALDISAGELKKLSIKSLINVNLSSQVANVGP